MEKKELNILVIGGTRFVGRHIVEEAIARNHSVTLFNRGTNHCFPGVTHIKGDRDNPEDLVQLSGSVYDSIIDTCGYYPRQINILTKVLSSSSHYVFISSISAYGDKVNPYRDESAELAKISPDTPEKLTNETYGGFKVLCEQAAQQQMPQTLIIRPGIVAGPFDTTDRFTYWPYRVAQGGNVLVPDNPGQPVQFIDARDLAAFTLNMVEKKETGAFNLVNTPGSVTMKLLVEESLKAAPDDSKIIWVDEDFLASCEIQPWQDLPFWIPGKASDLMLTSNSKALKAGLSIRPLGVTLQETLNWRLSLPEDYEPGAGLTREKEQQTLNKWFQRQLK